MGLAETWSTQIMVLVGRAAADEIRANYNAQRKADPSSPTGLSCFSPVVNICINPLWGRCQETYGEDPYLTSQLGYWFVRWMQNPGAPYPEVLTIVKHFAAYAGPEGYGFTFGPQAERFGFEAVLSERHFRETFLPAYRATLEAGAVGVMASYSAITLTENRTLNMENLPSSMNKPLLTRVLREELGLGEDGYVISDAGAVVFAYEALGHGHHVATSAEDAAVRCINAGLDIELTCCGAPAVFPLLEGAVGKGLVNESTVDRALARGLRQQFRLGVLDPPEAPSQNVEAYNSLTVANTVESEAHRQVALRAASEGLVLLRNGAAGGLLVDRQRQVAAGAAGVIRSPRSGERFEGSPDVLPWVPSEMSGQRVCVVGPLANDSAAVMGDYHPKPSRTIYTPFLGLQWRLQELDTQAEAVLEVGCSDYTYCPSFDAAAVTKAVQSCDRTVVALGLSARSMRDNVTNACGCPEGDAVEGECCDRYAAGLPGKQGDLLRAAIQAAASARTPHMPVVFANSAGMLDLQDVIDPAGAAGSGVAAVLHGAFLSEAAGLALADGLLGSTAPSGRLATTWYRDIGRAPGIKNYTGLDRGYHTAPESNIAVEFGYGLTAYGTGASYDRVFLYKYKPSGGQGRRAEQAAQEGDGRRLQAPGAGEDPVPIPACMAVGWTLQLCGADPEAQVHEAVQVYIVGNSSAPGAELEGRGRLVDFMKNTVGPSCAMFASQVMPEALAVLRQGDLARVLEPGVRCLRFGPSSAVVHGTGRVQGDVPVGMGQLRAAGAAQEACFDLQTPDGKPLPLAQCKAGTE